MCFVTLKRKETITKNLFSNFNFNFLESVRRGTLFQQFPPINIEHKKKSRYTERNSNSVVFNE